MRPTFCKLFGHPIPPTAGLTACKMFRAGERRFESKPEGERYQFSGFTVDVSDDSWETLSGQIEDAIAFLKKNKAGLELLRAAPGVEDMRLDFPVDLKIDRRNIMTQSEYFPPDLVSIAGSLGLGIELSVYPRDLEALASGTAEDDPAS
jgi:hypothetical protein